MKWPTLYKIDSKGKVRIWFVEQYINRYRFISGLEDGKWTESTWTVAEPKNVGRANATTAEEQAVSQIESLYTKQRETGYHDNKEDAGKGVAFFEPMLAEKYDKFQHGTVVFSQPKLDGVRCIAKSDGLWSRQGKKFHSVKHIERVLAPVFEKYPELILDGELYNHVLKEDFNEILSLVKKSKPTEADLKESERLVQYHVYDALFPRTVNFVDRNNMIGDVIDEFMEQLCGFIVDVDTVAIESEEELDQEFGRLLAEGYEGQIIRKNAPYENRRTKSLLKRKEFEDAEFTITAVNEGLGNWSGMAKTVEVMLPGDKRNEKGERPKATLKGNQDTARTILKEADQYVGGTATVRYQGFTPDGMPRFPIAVAVYKGKRDV